VGYGRAGKRHSRLAKSFGVNVVAVDPVVRDELVAYSYLSQALEHEWGRVQAVVIATPPDQHIGDIQLALHAGLPVLCEKPLCGLGQLDEAKKLPLDAPVMVFYNYRFHPSLLNLHERKHAKNIYELMAVQTRTNLPTWGLALDHLSHDLSIMDWLSGGIARINAAFHKNSLSYETWHVEGLVTGGIPFDILEGVRKDFMRPRYAYLGTPTHWTMVPRSEQMYLNAWRAFLQAYNGEGDWIPGLDVGIRVQELLEQVATKER